MPRKQRPLSQMSDQELREAMSQAAAAVLAQLPAGSQIILLASDGSNIGQYISTVTRESSIQLLRETADRIEGRQTNERVPFPSSPPTNGGRPDA